MSTIWKSIFITIIIFILLPIRTKRVSAQPMSQNIAQMQNVTGNMGGGTPTSSQPLPIGCCGEVSPDQQFPKPERKPDHNLRINKKTKKNKKKHRTRPRKSRKSPSVKKQNQSNETKRLSKEVVITETTNKNADEHIAQFVEFRKKLHSFFPHRADAIMDLIDALSANTQATSVVQLSLSPLFQRKYASLHDAIDNFFIASCSEKTKEERDMHQHQIMQILGSICPKPINRKFYLLALDATSQPRQFAKTLKDRGFVYRPNPIVGNKPITIGHSYSVLLVLPEKEGKNSPPWVIPLSSRRVQTENKATEIGAAQVKAIQEDKDLPFGKKLSILVADAAYSAVTFLHDVFEYKNQITITRVRGNRTFYRKPNQATVKKDKGHPRWYGTSFKCKDASTWGCPDERASTIYKTKRGRVCHVEIEAWRDMLMTGKKNIPMHEHPFTLLRTTVKDENGKAVYKKPLWTIVFGQLRHEVSLCDAWQAYRQRYDIEHFFRFGKNRLLMDSYQTPVVEHEENWWELSALAYAQLWMAAKLSQISLRPWERYLPNAKEKKDGLPTPSMVQRDMARIISQFATPVASPKPRGKSNGRQKGYCPGMRERYPVVKKG